MSSKEKIQDQTDILEKEVHLYKIILFNDDVNTFDHVIDSLIQICGHTVEQAEQCAVLVHYTGKCSVKSGEYKDLEPRCTALLNKGLTAEIA